MSGIRAAIFAALMLFTGVAFGQQSSSFDGFVIHYNAFRADFLQPETARTYGITRSNHRGILNIAIRKDIAGTAGVAVESEIVVQLVTLAGQMWPIGLRKIKEQDAIYYIGEFPVAHAENLKFRIFVTLPDSTAPVEITYQQQFFTK